MTQKLGFVDLGLQSFRVDCARACLSSVFVVHTATHQSLPAEVAANKSRPATYS